MAPDQRLAVFRSRRCVRILGPGTVWTLPFVEKVARIHLEQQVPHWRVLQERELLEEIRGLVRASGYEVAQ